MPALVLFRSRRDRRVRAGIGSVLVTLAPLLFLPGCKGRLPPNDLIPPRPSPANFGRLPSDPHLGVLVIGDWGTGGEGQRQVARAIEETHAGSPPEFVLTVGDNIYPLGVKGPRDPIWYTVFEDVYKGSFWDSLTFYPTLGNHDYMGQPMGQIYYSGVSSRWTMPDRHYALEKKVPGGGSVLFLAVDTDPITRGVEDPGIQRVWAQTAVEDSSADWTVLFGHHPVVSGGWHKTNRGVRSALLPLLEGKAALYVAGHNHSSEFLETTDGVLQAVCGGGGGLDNPYRVRSTPETWAAFTNGGWCFLRIWPEDLVVELYDREGGLQYRHFMKKSEARQP